jgi:hypothetical protein
MSEDACPEKPVAKTPALKSEVRRKSLLFEAILLLV